MSKNVKTKKSFGDRFLHSCLKLSRNLAIITQTGGDLISMAKKIKVILVERGMTIRQLGDRMGYSGSYLYNKLNRDKLTEQELKEIANALDCDYEGVFTMRDTGRKF